MGKKSKSRGGPSPRLSASVRAAKLPKAPLKLWSELGWLLPALVLGFLIYTNTLHGDFVYDDRRQIVRNTLIQDSSQFWRALTSDVWAFKGGEQTVSNYWRPSFVFGMICDFRLFGLETFGWHLTNILLHVGVIALAFGLLRTLAISRPVAGAIALIFAVHPVHTESVAWISGAPDLILCAALLGSLWFVHRLGQEQTPLRWFLALGLYAVALGAKESAILYPLIVLAFLYRGKGEPAETGLSGTRAFSIAWPFALTALIFLITRASILGMTQKLPGNGASFGQAILSAPAVFAFYLRQSVAPIWIGPSYPLRAVTLSSIGVINFVVPLVITMAAGWWMLWMARRSKTARIGLVLFLVPLLPAMNIVAFHPEQLVHDRYLYVPLLGFLVLVLPPLASLLQRTAAGRMGQYLIFAFALIVSIPLGAQTLIYNRAWTTNLALWEWAVRSDPNSALNYSHYGVALHEDKKLDEAVAAFDRSIEIAPAPSNNVTRATVLIDQGKYAEAERDLHKVTSLKPGESDPYTMYQAYDRLAISLTQQRKLNEAVDTMNEARDRLKNYRAALTEKLAVILYQAGRKDEALGVLNAVRAEGRTEPLPESRMVFYRIGLLNSELGHPADARAAFQEFLTLTQGMLTPEIKQARSESEAALRNARP